MPLPALILPMLAIGFGARAPDTKPVVVTGHQWAPFISPMGEPFRARTANDDTLADWFYKADRNRDGVLTVDELEADALRFFGTLDANHDGQIDPDELANYEYEIAPDIQVMSKTQRAPGQAAPIARKKDADENRPRDRRHRQEEDAALLGMGDALQGGARYGLLNMPEPVAAADTDFNRAISLDEFRQAAVARFQLLDSTHQGKLTLAQLEAMRPVITAKGHLKIDEKALDKRLGNPLPTGP